jgi:glycosyltransferase involved in cell wall biosynthesis
MLQARKVAARLVLIGGETGESDPTNLACSERVRGLIEKLGVAGQVTWSGFASPEEVSGHLAAADICVLPFRDGASLRRSSLLTSLEHGVPTVTTNPERPEPLLRDRENVLSVGSGEPKALADAIELLWRDRALMERLALGATTLARRFRWSEIAMEHHRMYQTILGTPSSTGRWN